MRLDAWDDEQSCLAMKTMVVVKKGSRMPEVINARSTHEFPRFWHLTYFLIILP